MLESDAEGWKRLKNDTKDNNDLRTTPLFSLWVPFIRRCNNLLMRAHFRRTSIVDEYVVSPNRQPLTGIQLNTSVL